ncbi:ABC transporter substrate-binding protein [Reyranella sp.]|uniref:ABC transporter substrate-binding protein n=1 Tax=Reyranella sp. TaxID=1929291 RepID=UPI003784E80E
MNRRLLLNGLAALTAFRASSSAARQRTTPVIGILGEGNPEDRAIAHNLAMFRRGLRQEGFIDGQNVDLVYRWARNRPERLPALADELVALAVDVLVNEGGTITALQAKKATSTIPIVFHASNAIADGLVDTLARPSGNLTGVSQFTTETLTKAYQLLGQVVPTAKGFALVSTGQAPSVTDRVLQDIRATTPLPVREFTVDSDADLEAAFTQLKATLSAAIVFTNVNHAARLVGAAARHRVPAVYNQRAFVEAGGLMSYGASIPASYVIKGLYAGRILKGAKPHDLPVQQPSRFELALNLGTAQSLGLAVPQSILLTADEVID